MMPEAFLKGLNATGDMGSSDSDSFNSNNDNDADIFRGLFIVSIGAFCFGTMHVPIRAFATGKEGFFIQWVMSFGSLMVGFVVNMAMGSPPIQLLASGGGALWTFANSISQFVIPSLGLAPAFLLWSTTNILTGWSAGRFGLFGLKKKVPEHAMLNVIGLVTIMAGGICFAMVEKSIPPTNKQVHVYPRTRTPRALERKREEDEDEMLGNVVFKKSSVEHSSFLLSVPPGDYSDSTPPPPTIISSSSKRLRKWMMRHSHRLLCILLSLLSGFFYSATVMPVIYIQDNPELFPGAFHSGLNYIFSHYFGIFLSSSAIFIIYALIKANKPTVNPSVILPALAGGAIWGCGMVCLFLSNDLLTQAVTYPVLITVPGCVASLWSIYFFREIEMNRQNSAIIGVSFALIFLGAFLSFISKSKLKLLDKLDAFG